LGTAAPTEAPLATATKAPTRTPTATTIHPAVQDFSAALQAYMLEIINQDRQANGRNPVAWDPVADKAGRLHAQDMVEQDYFSHWNRDGLGPDHRYTLAGGTHAVMENIHAFEYVYEDGRGAPIEDWNWVIENAQSGLMDSPGHRKNILDPAHTHVGVGMAYDPETGRFRLAQEFTNQYAQLDGPLPTQARLGESIVVRGEFIGDNLSNPLLNLAYEPFPAPLSVEELNQTSTYSSAATGDENMVDTRAIELEFDETIVLDHHQRPGLYHLRLFVDLVTGQTMVLDHVIEVR